ncbi:hypothetical protein O181_007695 [Austropuccinia psidii MF-1]|uniref:Uncharacterized protein n=1 Tax=Austropuccinia psidii MF-1 TaxID=1389203 RepID=A0A9Q3GI58_9BASI|nr:hypothetical protein [Austropuccinia psidii MF-1]
MSPVHLRNQPEDRQGLFRTRRPGTGHRGNGGEWQNSHQGESCIKRWQLTSCRTTRQDNVNHHMCHMRMSLKAQTHFNTICNVWVITPHGATKKFGMLTFVDEMTSAPLPACLCARTAPQMRLRHCPPSPTSPLLTLSHPRPYHLYTCGVPSQHGSNAVYHPYAHVVSSQHSLPSLRLRSAFPTWLQHSLPSLCSHSALPAWLRRLPSRHASNTAYHPYAHVVPSRHASNTAYHPYACVVPSRHGSNTAYHPYPRVVPSQHGSNTAYHPYADMVPSRHGSNTAYHPHARVVPS